MSLLSTLSPAGPRMIGGLTRRSLISAVTAMSTTSSPKRRPFGQPPGTVPAAESSLDLAGQHVSAEDAQAREPRVIGIDRIRCATAGETRRGRGQVHLDQVGDEDPGNVRPVRRRGHVAVEHERVDQRGELRLLGVLAEQVLVPGRARAAVEILVFEGDEPLVEERIALAGHLHEAVSVTSGPVRGSGSSPADGSSSRTRQPPAGRHRSRRAECSTPSCGR